MMKAAITTLVVLLAVTAVSRGEEDAAPAGTCRFTQDCVPPALDDLTCSPRAVYPNETQPKPFVGGYNTICPQYADSACCSVEQRQILKKSFFLIDITLGSLASAGGCGACAQNLKDIWCDYVCGPDQTYVDVHGISIIDDPESGKKSKVLSTTATVDRTYACKMFESCKDVAYVKQDTVLGTCVGFLEFQGRTEGIGHGNDISWNFTTNPTVHRIGAHQNPLPCCNYRLPGATANESCACNACTASCSANCGQNGGSDVSVKPVEVPALTGFNAVLVGGIYIGIAVLSSAALVFQRFWAKRQRKASQSSASSPA